MAQVLLDNAADVVLVVLGFAAGYLQAQRRGRRRGGA